MVPLVSIALLSLPFLIAASYFDLKTNEIPDWLSYGFLGCVSLILIFISLFYASWDYILDGLTGFVICLIIGLAFYYLRFWGGGDAKLLFGMGALFGGQALLDIALAILIALTIYLCATLTILSIRNWRKLIEELKKIKTNSAAICFFILAFILAILVFTFFDRFLGYALLALDALILFTYYLHKIIHIVESIALIKQIAVSRLKEEDWPAENIRLEHRTISKKCLGLTQKDIREIKESRIRHILIKSGILFAPAFLLYAILFLVISLI
ncbi:prepilin peptidase [archaeon]|nr:prepilin peptidase [archaeon]